MPLDVYRNRTMAVSVVVMFLSELALYGSIMFVPLFFQEVLGASATSSGSFLTPMMLAVVFGAILSGFLRRCPAFCFLRLQLLGFFDCFACDGKPFQGRPVIFGILFDTDDKLLERSLSLANGSHHRTVLNQQFAEEKEDLQRGFPRNRPVRTTIPSSSPSP